MYFKYRETNLLGGVNRYRPPTYKAQTNFRVSQLKSQWDDEPKMKI